jgi:hypothetical protein
VNTYLRYRDEAWRRGVNRRMEGAAEGAECHVQPTTIVRWAVAEDWVLIQLVPM